MMIRPRPSGKVAHCSPGAVILTPDAVRLLVRHHAANMPAVDPVTRLVIDDLERMSRSSPLSRDPLQEYLTPKPESEISTTEAGHRLGISPSGVRKRIQRGQLPARHNGRRWLIKTTDLKGQTT